MQIAPKSICQLFGFILLPDQVFELLRRQISPAQLVLADPGNGCVPVGKLLLIGSELDFGVLLEDVVAVVAVYDDAIPDDEWVYDHTVRQNVFLQLFQLFLSKRWNLAFKFRVNG